MVEMSRCIEAAKNGELHTLKQLCIEKGLEILNICDEEHEGYFPLYFAACKGHVDVCKFLISNGAEVDKRLHTGSTALHAAADRGQLECATQLIKSGCDVNLQNFNNFDSPLHLAAYRGHLEMCELLIQNGATLTLKNTHGKSPYDEAISENHFDTAAFLYGCWQKQEKSQHKTVDFVQQQNKELMTYKRNASYPCGGTSRFHDVSRVSAKSNYRTLHQFDWKNHTLNENPTNNYRPPRNKEGNVVEQTADLSSQNISKRKPSSFSDDQQHEFFFLVKGGNHNSHKEGLPCEEKRQCTEITKPVLEYSNPIHSTRNKSDKDLFLANQEVKSSPTLAADLDAVSKNTDKSRQNVKRAVNYVTKGCIDPMKSDNSLQCLPHLGNNITANTYNKHINAPETGLVLPRELRKNKTASENSPLAIKSQFGPKSTEVSDYINSLEMRVTNQSDRISFLENKNAQLWQECEDLRSTKANAPEIAKQNHKLKEQVHVLLHEIDQLRKLLQSSEGRSRYLAKQLFRYQHIVQLNNNQTETLTNTVPFSGYNKMESETERKEPKSDSQRAEHMEETVPRKRESSKSPAFTSHRKKKTPSRSPSSSRSRTSSSCSGSDSSVCSTKADHSPLLDAIRPVFKEAGQGFLMSMTDSLRQKLNSTLPNADERTLDSPGKRWQLNEEFSLLDEEPINEITPGCLEGACSLVYRIQHKEHTYILKMMINLVNLTCKGHGEGQSFPLYLFQQFSAEYNIPRSLPAHRNVIPVLHHFNGTTLDFHGALEKLVPTGFDVPIDMASETSFIVLPQYATTLGRLVEKRKQILTADQTAAFSDEMCLPEDFIAQKLFEVLAAVNHLSQNKIVHRDIKADNIFLDNKLSAVLGDFGMSRSLRTNDGNPIPFVESSQVQAGNSLAWAPELVQWHAEGPSSQAHAQVYLDDIYSSSDVYAIGVMFSSILSNNESEIQRSTDNLSSHVSPGLRFIVEKLLAPKSHRLTANQAFVTMGIHLFGPAVDEITTEEDCHLWIQAKMMKLLVCDPCSGCLPSNATLNVQSSIRHSRDVLEREFFSYVRSKELFQCYQEYRAALSQASAKS